MATSSFLSLQKEPSPYLFSLCSIVTNLEEHAAMKQSFEDCGFSNGCEYIIADNSKQNQFDAYIAVNRFIREAKGEYIIIVHQDVRCIDTISRLQEILTDLTKLDDKWAVCGNAGAYGYHRDMLYINNGGRIVKYSNLPAKVNSLDENLLIIRKSANIVISSDLKGFHLYGTDICIIADFLGYSCYVIPFMVKHFSHGNLEELDKHLGSFIENYGRKLRGRYIQTTCTKFNLSNSSFKNRLLNSSFFFFFVKGYERFKLIVRSILQKNPHKKTVTYEKSYRPKNG